MSRKSPEAKEVEFASFVLVLKQDTDLRSMNSDSHM